MRACDRQLWLHGFALTWLLAGPAAACPDCAAGQQARALIWSSGFPEHLVAVLLPFAVIVGLALGAERIARPRTGRGRKS